MKTFKSINRAVLRGHIVEGYVLPHRPFNNRKNTSTRPGIESRSDSALKKTLYGRLRGTNQRGVQF